MIVDCARLVHVLGLSLGACGQPASTHGVWQSDWTATFTPQALGLFYSTGLTVPQAPIAVTPDGELLVRTPSQDGLDDQIVRFDANGKVRWSVNIGSLARSDDLAQEAMLGRADGGAYVAASYGTAVANIDAHGNVIWTTGVYPSYLALDGDTLIVQSPSAVQAFDGASGQLLWQRSAPTASGYADAAGVVVDTGGAIYAGFVGQGQSKDPLIAKYDVNGVLLWQQHNVPPRVVGAGGGMVYGSTELINTTSALTTAALRAADGSIAWQANGAVGLGLVGLAPEVLVSAGGSIERLAAGDGSVRWSVASSDAAPALLFADTNSGKAIVGAMQIEVDTGHVDWTATLPHYDATGSTLNLTAAGRLANGNIAFGLLPTNPASGAPKLQQVNAATGSSAAPLAVPEVPQGLSGYTFANAQTLVNVASYRIGTDFHVGVRALDIGTGAVRWQTQAVPYPVQTVDAGYRGGTLAGDAVVVSETVNTGYGGQRGPGGVWLSAFDLATGAQRWTALFETLSTDRVQETTDAYDPIGDADGNVVVAYSAFYISPGRIGQDNYVQSVVKLRAADGSVVWRHDEIVMPNSEYAQAPNVSVIGNDVYVGGPFAPPHDQASLLKLSGADGSVQWASNVLFDARYPNSIREVRTAGGGNVIVSGGGQAELNAQTGATLWTNPPGSSVSCTGICANGSGEVVLPNGDAYVGAENGSRAELVLNRAQAGASEQVFTLDAADTHPRQSWVYTLHRAADGMLWAGITRLYPNTQSTRYLLQFDPVTQTVRRQQALYVGAYDATLERHIPTPQAAPQNERLPVQTYALGAPLPATLGAAVLDTTVTATGNLSLSFDTDKTTAAVGTPVNFHLHVAYTGNAAIAGARLLADFPWVGRATGVACATRLAANCILDPRSDTLVATFDMQPGGSIDLTGQIRASAGATAAKLGAVVAGPLGLNELDTTDNAAQVIVNVSPSASGVE